MRSMSLVCGLNTIPLIIINFVIRGKEEPSSPPLGEGLNSFKFGILRYSRGGGIEWKGEFSGL